MYIITSWLLILITALYMLRKIRKSAPHRTYRNSFNKDDL